MTEAEVIDRINSTIKKNGKNAITGDEMNFVLKAIIQLIADTGGTVNWGDIEGTISDQLDLVAALNNKVDVVSGKGLSTNDFTNTLKTKLDNIEAGAEVNVNADWNATSGDAQILNKPTIPNPADFVAKSEYSPAHSVLVQQSGTGSPTSVQIGNNEFLGRKSGGGADIEGLSVSESKAILNYTASDVEAVPTIRNLTINGVTQDLSADRTFSIASGITVNTTAITSGTDGRVFFQAGGVIQQDAAFFWDNTNKRLGVGATPASTARLDVRAQGALSTDIAFRVRNSADTKNLANITGLGDVYLGDGVTVTNQGTEPLIAIGKETTVNGIFNSNPIAIGNTTTAIGNSIAIGKGSLAGSSGTNNNIAIGYNAIASGGSGGSSPSMAIGTNVSSSAYGTGGIVIGHGLTTTSQSLANIVVGRYINSVQGFIPEAFAFGSGVSNASRALLDVGNSFSIYINENTRALFLNQKSNLVFRNGQSLTSGTHFDANATNTFTLHSGTAPASNIVDAAQQYTADVVAGNAAPHFRTENGAIVKVYQETTGVGASTLVTGVGTPLTDTDTFDGYTLKQIVKALRNQGLLA